MAEPVGTEKKKNRATGSGLEERLRSLEYHAVDVAADVNFNRIALFLGFAVIFCWMESQMAFVFFLSFGLLWVMRVIRHAGWTKKIRERRKQPWKPDPILTDEELQPG